VCVVGGCVCVCVGACVCVCVWVFVCVCVCVCVCVAVIVGNVPIKQRLTNDNHQNKHNSRSDSDNGTGAEPIVRLGRARRRCQTWGNGVICAVCVVATSPLPVMISDARWIDRFHVNSKIIERVIHLSNERGLGGHGCTSINKLSSE
jgi:hypothetical protein